MNDNESMQHNEPIDLDRYSQEPADTPRETLESKLYEQQSTGVPFEPVPDGDTPEPGESMPAQNLRQLFEFFLFGVRNPEIDAVDDSSAIPALLHQYQDMSLLRLNYPLCLDTARIHGSLKTLTQIIDELVTDLADDSDEGRFLTQQLYRIESEIRHLVRQEYSAGLLGLWDRASKQLLSALNLEDEKRALLREKLGKARHQLQIDHEMIDCNDTTAKDLFRALACAHWRTVSASWRADLELMIQQLQDILSLDGGHSQITEQPDHLRDASGHPDDEIDFDALSSIINESRLTHHLPEHRVKRLRSALEYLLWIRPMFDPESAADEEASTLPFPGQNFAESCADAIQEYERRMAVMTRFFRAVNITRLEVANDYQEALHDEYFERFDHTHLTDDELALCPPVLLILKSDSMSAQDIGDVMNILTSGVPVKILLQNTDVFITSRDEASHGPIRADPSLPLATMAMTLPGVFVLQAAVSQLPDLYAEIGSGLAFAGPAILSIYTGPVDTNAELPGFLTASAAMESRIFPTFVSDPGRGTDLALRFDVTRNTQCDRPWPKEQFTYMSRDKAESAIDLAFTPADFLFNDQRFRQYFWSVPEALWHEKMVPLQEYLQMDTTIPAAGIPYILTVDAQGRLCRTIMHRSVVAAVLQCAASWRHIQEIGGINNSYTTQALADEKARLAGEKQHEISAVEEKYALQLDEDIGKLTEEIVDRIATQLLLDGGTVTGVLSKPLPAAKGETPAAALAESEAGNDVAESQIDDEEPPTLDDPYIDTPLCTSCDDCTNINNQLFAYDDNKQAYIRDPAAGTYKDLVRAAELCPVNVIHPGKPRDPNEPGIEDLMKRAEKFM